MNVSAMNCHYRFYTLEDFFWYAHKNGFENVEIWTGPMHFYLDYRTHTSIDVLRNLEKKYKIKVIGICPEQTNPKPNNMCVKDKKDQERVFSYFKNAIDVASEIKANQVVVTSGWAYYSEDAHEALIRSAQMMRRLAAYAEEKDVYLAIEALQPRESILVNTIADLKTYLNLVNHDNLKICLDLGAMAKANESISEYFDTFQDRIKHCHFVDGKPIGHLAWGDGDRDIFADLNDFAHYNYQGYLSFEIVNQKYYQEPYFADYKSIQLFNKWKKKYKEEVK
ncbi:MAG: sugar phosphate isomerase/epimerase family protein [Kandleria vitulina]|nr:sugar phosphate isomerase/epimerase family protein [Kandleria vitulina]MEE0989674.1 sugar phosphate isomerase/epimerase family protein [Kandleria vitulina]